MTQLTASRSRLLSITVLWASAFVVLVLLCFILLRRIEFQASGFQSLAVDLSFIIISLPVCLASLVAFWKTLQPMAIALWPGFVGITFDANHLFIIRGPFGCRCYETKSLDIRYPFELSADEMEGHVEAFLPKQQQYETLLPRMCYPGSRVGVDRLIQQLLQRCDGEIAAVMRPMIQQWKAHSSST